MTAQIIPFPARKPQATEADPLVAFAADLADAFMAHLANEAAKIERAKAQAPAPIAAPVEVVKFAVGKVYTCRSACDYDTVFAWEVIARTDKTLTLKDWRGDTVKRGVKVYDGEEYCSPDGRYSMAPQIRAGRAGEGRAL